MEMIILQPNAAPVYRFLSLIHAQNGRNEQGYSHKVLDCGAGGSVPPVALFGQHGFEACGIDISPDELAKAAGFCAQKGVQVSLRPGDMRQIPYPDESFDYVYEHYSMCHLSKSDTAVTVREMGRVLKPGGLCMLGVISDDTWPRSLFGEEREPGEFYGEEDGVQNVLHTMFSDEEADELVASWRVLLKEKQVRYLIEDAENTSLDEWLELRKEWKEGLSQEDWREKYSQRAAWFRYVHLYYVLKKS